jgi:dTDP-glucose pyrophosphorylase
MIPVAILAAGGGKRLGEIGARLPKALLPVGDGALLELHLRAFLAAGSRRFVIVTDPADSKVEAAARAALAGTGAELHIVPQAERLGIGHAALLALPRLGEGPFALVLGDTYYSSPDFSAASRAIAAGEADTILSVREVADEAAIRKECTIDLDPSGRVLKIIEKPKKALSMVKPCGVYFFGRRFREALAATRPSALRGEIELTDAIQELIEAGGLVRTMRTLDLDVNITFPADVIKANLAWLDAKKLRGFAHPEASVGAGASLAASVAARGSAVGAGARLERCVVFPGGKVEAGASLADTLVLEGLAVKAAAGA